MILYNFRMEGFKRCKVIQHQRLQQKQYSGEEIVFCTKDFPFLAPDDILEIYNPDEDYPRLLLKVGKKSIRDDCFSHKDALSIEQSIAAAFQLKPFSDVIVKKVTRQDVELDSVELTFKDQYLGRSEMWRLKNSLVDSCIYVGRKIEFASSIRCQVHEMWSHGDKVACGVITASTKIVFRSSTSMVYLFIQMSSEMWEFDIYGDLYFEKAVNGFLAELFAKWKKNGSNHEVTIVLFSRLYYEANSLDQFPESIRLCLQTDYKGRFYEDYYRIAVQNGRYDDWGNTLILLKHIFVDYQRNLLNLHKKANPGLKLPKSYISTASRGNFLEVLNMSLNVFETHYKDRSFDRTGQLSVVITPGVGVFEVDRDLTNVTMQRIIDNGVGSDLVCVGEQPLHAVPLLLKFTNKMTSQSNMEDYSMPHWINLSFYSSNKKVGYSSYVPRIKLPMFRQSSRSQSSWDWFSKPHCRIPKLKQDGTENPWPNSIYDFDDYDQKIFQLSASSSVGIRNQGHRRALLTKNKRINPADYHPRFFKRQNSEPEIHQGTLDFPLNFAAGGSNGEGKAGIAINQRQSESLVPPSPAITIPAKKMAALNHHLYSSSFGALNIEIKSKVGSNNSKENWLYDDIWSQKLLSPSSSSLQSGNSPKDKTIVYTKQNKEVKLSSKALINPFDPSHAVIKLTSSRRRWTHIFPRGPTGALIQQHHRHSTHSALEIVHEGLDSSDSNPSPSKSLVETPSRSSGRNSVTKQASVEAKLTLMWGATGEQEWTPALQTGVDWKSLTIPACLPLTTDYFPDERSLDTDYVVSAYSLLPDDVNAEYAQQRVVYRPPLTTVQVFAELVSQRLAQGFQLVIRPILEEDKSVVKAGYSSLLRSTNQSLTDEGFEEYVLSIGRVFHKIQLEGSTITVIRYRPKHAYPSLKFHYTYRLNSPNSTDYEASAAVFSTEKLENYSWNYLDHYICTRGDKGYALHESLKFWRFRMYLLPNSQAATKKILEGSEVTNIYSKITEEETRFLVENFLKFVEGCVNRLRRAACKKRIRGISTTIPPNFASANAPTGFRERVGSTKLSDRGRTKAALRDVAVSQEVGGLTRVDGALSPLDHPSLEFTFNYPESLPNSISDNFFAHGQAASGAGHEDVEEPEVLLANSTSGRRILEAMCLPNSGFMFVKSDDLPQWTFVSADAVHWLMGHMEGIRSIPDGILKFQELLQQEYITHASGNLDHVFTYGFCLYSIRCFAKDGDNFRQLDLEMFQDDWLEVEVSHVGSGDAGIPPPPPDEDPTFSEPGDWASATNKERKAQLYKRLYLDVDLGKKSDRQEWGHLLYQDLYNADEAFELVVQWVQATGSIITELIQGWSRKAQQCSMQLVPIPCDPFAVSSSSNSDSLRGPIFIPLDTDGYKEGQTFLFEDFPEETWPKLMADFQESIITQFGFIPCLNPSKDARPNRHYVHLTGNMFLFIPATDTNSSKDLMEARGRRRYDSPALIGSQDDFITRHVSGKKRDGFLEDPHRVGFLWSWNYMLSKRWKTSSTPALGDEAFMMKMLRDFQGFCSNQDDRLRVFWENMFGAAVISPTPIPVVASQEPK